MSSSGLSSSSHCTHEFRRDRSINSCMICSDMWPSGEGVISKFNVCTKCDLRVHSSCVQIARDSYPCDKETLTQKITSHSANSLNCQGRITARVLHCYDIDVLPGSNLYCVLSLSTGDATIKGPISVAGDRDCVWSASLFTQEDTFACYWNSSQVEDIHLTLYIWKSVMRVFDSEIAMCEVKMKPLFMHPNMSIERWFELKDLDGRGSAGKVLVALRFSPFKELPKIPQTVTASCTESSSSSLSSTTLPSRSTLDNNIENNDSLVPSSSSPSSSSSVPVTSETIPELSLSSTSSPAHLRSPKNRAVSDALLKARAELKRVEEEAVEVERRGLEYKQGIDEIGKENTMEIKGNLERKSRYGLQLPGRLSIPVEDEQDLAETISVNAPQQTEEIQLEKMRQLGYDQKEERSKLQESLKIKESNVINARRVAKLYERNLGTRTDRGDVNCSILADNDGDTGNDGGSPMQRLATRENLRAATKCRSLPSTPTSSSEQKPSSISPNSNTIPVADSTSSTLSSSPSSVGSKNRIISKALFKVATTNKNKDKIDDSKSSSTSSTDHLRVEMASSCESSQQQSTNADFQTPPSSDKRVCSSDNIVGISSSSSSSPPIINLQEIEEVVEKVVSQQNSPYSPSTVEEKESQETTRDEIAEEMKKIEEKAVNLFSDWNNVDKWATWARKTTMQAQAQIQTVWPVKKSEKKRKGGEFNGVGVGKIYVYICSAVKEDAEHNEEGNYYVLVSINDGDQEERTKIVHSSSHPIYDTEFQFIAPHFRSGVRMDLMDGDTDTCVGTSYTSIYSLILRDADYHESDWRNATEQRYDLRETLRSDKDPIGHIKAKIQFEEDVVGLFTGGKPHLAPEGPAEELSVERLRVHISRFRSLIAGIQSIYSEYCSIMNWDEPLLTLVLFIIFLTLVLKVDAEYSLSGPMFLLVILMTKALYMRRTGKFRQRWIQINDKNPMIKDESQIHRSVALLRFSIVSFRGFTSSMTGVAGMNLQALEQRAKRQDAKPPYVKVAYFPERTFLEAETLSIQTGNVSGSSPRGHSGKECASTETKSSSFQHHTSSIDDETEELDTSLYGTPERASKDPHDPSSVASNHTSTSSVDDHSKKGHKREHIVACINTTIQHSQSANSTTTGGHRLTQLMSSLNFLRPDSGVRDELLQNVNGPWPMKNITDDLDFDVFGDDHTISKTDFLEFEKNENHDICFVYPILQPTITVEDHEGLRSKSTKVESWGNVESLLKFSMYGDHPMSRFLDSAWNMAFDVNLRDLVDSEVKSGLQKERWGWFDVKHTVSKKSTLHADGTAINDLPSASGIDDFDYTICKDSNQRPRSYSDQYATQKDLVSTSSSSSSSSSTSTSLMDGISTTSISYLSSKINTSEKYESDNTGAQVLVRMQLELPHTGDKKHASIDTKLEEIEKSIVLQKILYEENDKSGNALSVLFNMRDNIKYVQNLMNSILNAIESYKNLFNWTSPSKTLPIYITLVLVWVLTITIPGRYIILAIGLYQFFEKFLKFDPVPNMIRLQNIMEALPNDDDIQEAYRREQKTYEKHKEDELRLKMRSAKLNLIFTSLWSGSVQIKAIGIGNGVIWSDGYAVLQETRFVWWLSEDDIDDGKPPQGQLLLFGHAGVTQPSPVDVREIGDDNRLVTIFGRDPDGMPHKWTLLCKSSEMKTSLVQTVNTIVNEEALTRLNAHSNTVTH